MQPYIKSDANAIGYRETLSRRLFWLSRLTIMLQSKKVGTYKLQIVFQATKQPFDIPLLTFALIAPTKIASTMILDRNFKENAHQLSHLKKLMDAWGGFQLVF
jgi:hypothetical protein